MMDPKIVLKTEFTDANGWAGGMTIVRRYFFSMDEWSLRVFVHTNGQDEVEPFDFDITHDVRYGVPTTQINWAGMGAQALRVAWLYGKALAAAAEFVRTYIPE